MNTPKVQWISLDPVLQAQMKKADLRTVLAVRQNNLPKLCLVKAEGHWNALKDKCPHQGVELSGGKCTPEGFIECPWHKFQFDIKTGREKKNVADAVQTYLVRENEGSFEIGIPKKWWQVF